MLTEVEFDRQKCDIYCMAYPKTYDPDRLEVHINAANAKGGRGRQWKWSVCEISRGPIASGIVTGARQKAVEAGNVALAELVAKAQKRDAKS